MVTLDTINNIQRTTRRPYIELLYKTRQYICYTIWHALESNVVYSKQYSISLYTVYSTIESTRIYYIIIIEQLRSFSCSLRFIVKYINIPEIAINCSNYTSFII